MNRLDERSHKTACYIGIILIIVGYVSFTNHRDLGNLVTIVGALAIIINKTINRQTKETSTDNYI